MSQLVRLEGKHSTQNAHCAVLYSVKALNPELMQIFFDEHFYNEEGDYFTISRSLYIGLFKKYLFSLGKPSLFTPGKIYEMIDIYYFRDFKRL